MLKQVRFKVNILLLFLFFGGGTLSGNDDICRRISLIYNGLSKEGVFTQEDFAFLGGLQEMDLAESPDSIKYQYHYLFGSWLDAYDGDLTQRIFHVSAAVKLVETSKSVLEYSIFDIEYLWLLQALARYYEEQDFVDDAIVQYERTLLRGRMIDKDLPNKNLRRVKSNCLLSLGDLYGKKGFEREAIECYKQAFEVSKIDYEPNTGDVEGYFPLWSFANYYYTKNNYSKAVDIWNELIHFFEAANAEQTLEYADAFYQIGAAYEKQRQYNLAITSYRKIIETYKNVGNIEESLKAYGNLFCIYADMGNMEGFNEIKTFFYDYYLENQQTPEYYKTLWAASTLLPAQESNVVKEDLMAAFSQLELSQQIRLLTKFANDDLQSDPNQAIVFCNQALELIEKSEHKDSAPGWYYDIESLKGIAYKDLNNIELAIESCEKAFSMLSQIRSINKDTHAGLLFSLSNLYLDAKRYSDVIIMESQLLPMIIEMYGIGSSYANNLTILGIGQMYCKKYKDALASFEQVAQIVEKEVGRDNMTFATNLHNIGRAYMLKGDKKKAKTFLLEAKELQLDLTGAIDEKTNQYLNELGIYE